jgi:hypothetical protein
MLLFTGCCGWCGGDCCSLPPLMMDTQLTVVVADDTCGISLNILIMFINFAFPLNASLITVL